MPRRSFVLFFALAPLLHSQSPSGLATILARLDKLEAENRVLTQQVADLQSKLAAAPAIPAQGAQPASGPGSLGERVAIAETRIADQAQSKVEASEKFPIRITGMALFNTYLNSRSGASEYPTTASLTPGTASDGATLRQSIIGLDFHGPHSFLGADVSGSLAMDFTTGGNASTFHLRTGDIELKWKTRRLLVGLDKPIFNPREPSSLAQVAISPLTGAGNLWLWLYQTRFEQDFAFTHSTGLRARVGVVQTRESSPYDAAPGAVSFAAARPAAEGRVEFYHNFDEDRRMELSGGFHVSETHASGVSIPSRVYSSDWFLNPWKPVEISGVFFTGENVANLGTGAVNQGYFVYGKSGEAIVSRGGWNQFTLRLLPRVSAHLFGGLQYYENSHLGPGDVSRNFQYGANVYFRIAPNVLLGPEISQIRTAYIAQGARLNNHYDLALAYLF